MWNQESHSSGPLFHLLSPIPSPSQIFGKDSVERFNIPCNKTLDALLKKSFWIHYFPLTQDTQCVPCGLLITSTELKKFTLLLDQILLNMFHLIRKTFIV